MSGPTHQILDVRNDISLHSLLLAIKSHSAETTVKRLWHGIITSFFPREEGYAVYNKDPQSNSEIISDCEVLGVPRVLVGSESPEIFVQKEVLVVVCKTPLSENGTDWAEEGEELIPYMRPIPQSQSHIGPPGEFIAIAKGTRVRFFRWESEAKKLEALHDEPLDLTDVEHAGRVTTWLNRIKDDTWEMPNILEEKVSSNSSVRQ